MRDELRARPPPRTCVGSRTSYRDKGRRLRLPDDVLFDIDLAVEEASTNIVRHAYGPGQEGDLQVRIVAVDGDIRITLTDWGQPFEANRRVISR